MILPERSRDRLLTDFAWRIRLVLATSALRLLILSLLHFVVQLRLLGTPLGDCHSFSTLFSLWILASCWTTSSSTNAASIVALLVPATYSSTGFLRLRPSSRPSLRTPRRLRQSSPLVSTTLNHFCHGKGGGKGQVRDVRWAEGSRSLASHRPFFTRRELVCGRDLI